MENRVRYLGLRLRKQPCPHCGTEHNVVAIDLGKPRDRRPPRAGDRIICIDCCEVAAIGDDGLIRLRTEVEVRADAQNPDIARGIRQMQINRAVNRGSVN